MKFAVVGDVGDAADPGSFNPSRNVTSPESSKTVGTNTVAPLSSVFLTSVRTSDASTDPNCVGSAPEAALIDWMIKYDDDVPSVCCEVQPAMNGSTPSASTAARAEPFVVNQRVQVVMAILSEEFAG